MLGADKGVYDFMMGDFTKANMGFRVDDAANCPLLTATCKVKQLKDGKMVDYTSLSKILEYDFTTEEGKPQLFMRTDDSSDTEHDFNFYLECGDGVNTILSN